MEQRDLKSTCFGQRFHAASRFVECDMRGNIVSQWMQQDVAIRAIVVRGRKVGLEQIAAKAGIDQIAVAVIAPRADRNKMIDGQFASGVLLTNVAIATPRVIASPHRVVFRVRHGLLLHAQQLPCLFPHAAFEKSDFRVQFLTTLLQQ